MKQLCFQVSDNDLYYTIIDRGSKQIESSASCKLTGRVAELKREEATEFIRSQGLNEFEGEVSLSYVGARSTLVPQMIFGETNAKEVFELSFGQSEKIIEHTRFFEQALVNVYEIEDWIKRFFVIRYPRINIQHETTHVLRGIFEKNTFQPTIHVSVNNSHFSLFAVSKNQLDFFNTFEFTNTEDLLYYTMHTVNNLSYSKKDWSLIWHSDDNQEELFTNFIEKFKRSSTTKNMEVRQISKIKHQLLCV
jgi:hypothetical protein